MKKIIFTGLLLATLGTAEVTAKDFANVKVETQEAAQFLFTYKVTYSTETVGGCVISYKHTTKYFLGCPLYTITCEIGRDCSGTGGGE